jgi:hypothetical protein
MISLLLAAAMQTAPVVISQSPSDEPVARYIRLQMKVRGYGMDGTATLLVDRRSGRYAERFDLGPESFSQGFDGARAWQADVNGTAAVQGNSIDRGTIAAWGYLFAFPRQARVTGSTVHYDDVPQAVTITEDGSHVRRFTMFNGLVNEVADFSAYHTFANGLTAPGAITFTDDNGTWTAGVTGATAVSNVTDAGFAPPRRNDDAGVAGGITSVPFLIATEIIIPVRIDNGPTLHFILDTGGQNVLLASAVKRLALHTVGHGTVGGAGASVIPTSFVTVRSVRVGNAQMRNQPFLVLDTPLLKGIDGILGYELLSRFAVRVDYRTNTVTLASSVPASWIRNVAATPFSFRSRQPAVAGAIDGIPALLTIDTGNSGVLDINSPFAAEHRLWAYYHAAKPKRGSLAGVGGTVPSANVTVHHLRIGTAALQNVYSDLTEATTGIEAHPAVAANAGEGVFRNFTFILDYAHQRLYFAPGGIRDKSGVILARSGDRIVVRQVRTHTAMRFGVRPGMTLTSLNGRRVSGRDFAAVQAVLQGTPGSKVDFIFDARKRVKLMLVDYL